MKNKNLTKPVCFWNCENFSDKDAKQEALSHVVPGWNLTPEAKYCVELMETGRSVSRYKGTAMCRICEKRLGSADNINQGWIYPEDWQHYILEHSVKPWDEEFLAFLNQQARSN